MFGIVTYLIALAVSIFTIVCTWKVYKKAGKQGWESIIPIYSNIVLLEIVDLPLWYIVLYFIPFANIYVAVKVYIELAHKFNKSTGFGIGLFFLPVIFIAILAFEKDSTVNVSNSQAVSQNSSVSQGGRYCPNCGNKVSNDSDFCANCGNKMN